MSSKLSEKRFNDLFSSSFGAPNDNVIAAPKYGVDVALIRLGNAMAMASASDPLSYLPGLGAEKSAWLSVHLAANDIATTSVMPQFLQMVLTLPQHLSDEEVKTYWQAMHHFCAEAGIAITGGHTAFPKRHESTLAGGATLFAIGPESHFLTSEKAKAGQVLILTKKAAIASVAILGLQFPSQMEALLGSAQTAYFESLFFKTSVLKEGRMARRLNANKTKIHAMHDVTEGGVVGAAYEFCSASNLGLRLNLDKVPVDATQKKVCAHFGLSPYRIIGAGSMLMAVQKENLEEVLDALHHNHIEATVIGRFLPKEEGKTVIENGKEAPLTPVLEDPYWNAFEKALCHETL